MHRCWLYFLCIWHWWHSKNRRKHECLSPSFFPSRLPGTTVITRAEQPLLPFQTSRLLEKIVHPITEDSTAKNVKTKFNKYQTSTSGLGRVMGFNTYQMTVVAYCSAMTELTYYTFKFVGKEIAPNTEYRTWKNYKRF